VGEDPDRVGVVGHAGSWWVSDRSGEDLRGGSGRSV
jgi:hypothetical protein